MLTMPTDDNGSSSGSDYEVESHINAKRVRRTLNDDTADLLGNFDDEKRNEILLGTSYVEKQTEEEDSSPRDPESDDATSKRPLRNGGDVTTSNGSDEDSSDEEEDEDGTEITNMSKEQLSTLLRGVSKANRYVLYVTNLNFESSRADLEAHFGAAGTVKSVRIPKKRRGGFAFVEMADLDGFHNGFRLHNTELQGRSIKVQLSEAGKKKSANKKNIMKQKNRKLAEMRNEQKTFTKSGKFYDKTIKKEKVKEMLERKRWRKPRQRIS